MTRTGCVPVSGNLSSRCSRPVTRRKKTKPMALWSLRPSENLSRLVAGVPCDRISRFWKARVCTLVCEWTPQTTSRAGSVSGRGCGTFTSYLRGLYGLYIRRSRSRVRNGATRTTGTTASESTWAPRTSSTETAAASDRHRTKGCTGCGPDGRTKRSTNLIQGTTPTLLLGCLRWTP